MGDPYQIAVSPPAASVFSPGIQPFTTISTILLSPPPPMSSHPPLPPPPAPLPAPISCLSIDGAIAAPAAAIPTITTTAPSQISSAPGTSSSPESSSPAGAGNGGNTGLRRALHWAPSVTITDLSPKLSSNASSIQVANTPFVRTITTMSEDLPVSTLLGGSGASAGLSPTNSCRQKPDADIRRGSARWFCSPSEWRVPLKVLLALSLCFFTVFPAVILWYFSWKTGTDGVASMEDMGEHSVESVATYLRKTMVESVRESLSSLFGASESAMDQMVFVLESDDSLASSGFDFRVIARHNMTAFFLLRASAWMQMTQLLVYTNISFNYVNRTAPNPAMAGLTTTSNVQSYTYTRMKFDIFTGALNETIYLGTLVTNPYWNSSTASSYVADRRTGALRFIMKQEWGYVARGWYPVPPSMNRTCQWLGDIEYDSKSGLPNIPIQCFLPNSGRTAMFIPMIYTNVYTVSAFLRSLIAGPKERLFLCFQNTKGSLIGASHGKFFSHSDIDFQARNPLTNPVPVKDFKVYSPLDSNDTIIPSAGKWVMEQYTDWANVPNFDEVVFLVGEYFWFLSSRISTRYGLNLQLYLLIDRESNLGSIERMRANTLSEIAASNWRLTFVLIGVVLAALGLALLFSFLLSRSLHRLAVGMDRLAMLRFDDAAQHGPSEMVTTISRQSLFSEVGRCEGSFSALERGMKAFIKYVPRDVVRLMLSGEMESENKMVRKTLTILFMDIVGFSSLCERIRADQLILLTTQYLQEMCQIIVGSHGVLDKFIGDCIMAIWNAPRPHPSHASAAIGAALDMQTRLVHLNRQWEDEGFPQLRFRCGINTARVLVGNYGCDYRISFTCLGDGVNLASRLEAANKPFGTVVMVSESTFNATAKEFVFRTLGRITVAGKEEVLLAFEPICRVAAEAPTEFFRRQSSVHPIDSMASITLPMLRTEPTNTNPNTEPSPQSCKNSNSEAGLTNSPPLEFRKASSAADQLESILFHWETVPFNAVYSMVQTYQKGLNEYMKGCPGDAEKLFRDAQAFVPSDEACKLMIEMCRDARVRILTDPTGWDSVLRFDRKL